MRTRKVVPKLLWSVLASASACMVAAHAAQPFYFGVGTHIGMNKLSATEAMSLYSAGGFNSFRDETFWHRLEAAKGDIKFPASLKDLDQVVTRVSGAGGSPMIILDYGNIFYDLGDITYTDTGIAGFVHYTKFVVSHYKGRVPMYEVWNEWNIGMGSSRKPRTIRPVSSYIDLLRPTIDAVRSVDPSAKVIAGSVAGPDDKWIDEFIAKGGLKGIDGFSVHPYIYQQPKQNRPEDAADWLQRLDAKLTSANKGRPMDIYVTEIGWPNHQGPTGWAPQQTADFYLRFHILARAVPSIRGVWWYELRDGGSDPNEKEHRFGIVDKNLGAKPAFKALKTAVALLPPDAKVTVSQPVKGAFKARIVTSIEQCTAYWSREGQVSVKIPEGDLAGRLVWGTKPQAEASEPAVITESPVIACRPA
jgi:hypothetical protein